MLMMRWTPKQLILLMERLTLYSHTHHLHYRASIGQQIRVSGPNWIAFCQLMKHFFFQFVCDSLWFLLKRIALASLNFAEGGADNRPSPSSILSMAHSRFGKYFSGMINRLLFMAWRARSGPLFIGANRPNSFSRKLINLAIIYSQTGINGTLK